MKALRGALVLLLIGSAFVLHRDVSAKTILGTTLSGTEEVPSGSGDPDGTGSASLTLKAKKRRICFDLAFSNISATTAGHIHEGPAGADGPAKVTLFSGAITSPFSDCIRAPKSQIRDIADSAEEFYVNVHTSDFPDGAIRGQLAYG